MQKERGGREEGRRRKDGEKERGEEGVSSSIR
jgi:hypothetical protein